MHLSGALLFHSYTRILFYIKMRHTAILQNALYKSPYRGCSALYIRHNRNLLATFNNN